jgi:hypothetical protein
MLLVKGGKAMPQRFFTGIHKLRPSRGHELPAEPHHRDRCGYKSRLNSKLHRA